MHSESLIGKPWKGRDHLGNIGESGRIILKRILNKSVVTLWTVVQSILCKSGDSISLQNIADISRDSYQINMPE